MTTDDSPDAVRRRRLLFRATHRGTKETDLLVGGFVTRNLMTFSDPELAAVEAVLELPDPSLADWLTGREPVPEADRSPMLARMIVEARGA